MAAAAATTRVRESAKTFIFYECSKIQFIPRRQDPPAMVPPAMSPVTRIRPQTTSSPCTRRRGRTTTPRPPGASMSSRTGDITSAAGRTARHTDSASALDQRDKASTPAPSTKASKSAESTG